MAGIHKTAMNFLQSELVLATLSLRYGENDFFKLAFCRKSST